MSANRDDHIARNRKGWNADSDSYQAAHGSQLSTEEPGWGVWQIPEDRLGVLGPVAGRDVLELGCGAAQWSIALSRRGARPVGIDLSERQLTNAVKLMEDCGARFPLVHGSAEQVPFREASFDVVFCDHGALSFTDPMQSIPEASRLLRPGGLLAFCTTSPLHVVCWPATGLASARLERDYFGMRRYEDEDGVSFQLPYGEWLRLFRQSGLELIDLIEPRPDPDATTTYVDYVSHEWARRWPAECIWKLRKS